MQLNEWKVEEFTPETLAATKEAWLKEAVELDMPSLDYEKDLEWAAGRINYKDHAGDSLAYAIKAPDGAVAALLEVVYTRRAGPVIGWLKMMTVKVSPRYAPSEVEANAEKLALIPVIYITAIQGTVKLTNSHKAKVVKLYGRDNTLLTLLVSLQNYMINNLGDTGKFDVRMEGRWLVIATN